MAAIDRGEAGYTGDMETAINAMFAGGVHVVAANGVIGDPDPGQRGRWRPVTGIR